MTTSPDIEMTDNNLKLQPKALLKMFVELGRKAQKELDKRAKASWDTAETNFAKKWRKKYKIEPLKDITDIICEEGEDDK